MKTKSRITLAFFLLTHIAFCSAPSQEDEPLEYNSIFASSSPSVSDDWEDEDGFYDIAKYCASTTMSLFTSLYNLGRRIGEDEQLQAILGMFILVELAAAEEN